MVCEGCASGEFSCVPGCRQNSQCRLNLICTGPVVCNSCPCPPGWCESDPCLDLDNDGYVQSCDPKVVCPGKKLCDCNDFNGNVNPGRAEVCNNGLDDNCDGVYEWADPVCGNCPSGQNKCTNTWSCGAPGALTCNNGCCSSCPALVPPQCAAGKCAGPGGINPATGCPNAPTCVDCGACPKNVALVCGANGATFNNACEAQVAAVEVLHDGACVAGENISCNFQPVGSREPCGPNGTMYCRDACPQCAGNQQRCTQVGACARDEDCPAGNASLRCPDGGVAPERCVNHACAADCH